MARWGAYHPPLPRLLQTVSYETASGMFPIGNVALHSGNVSQWTPVFPDADELGRTAVFDA